MPTTRWSSAPRTAVIYGVTAAGAVVETIGLKASGMVGALPLAPQATALPVLGAFNDVRWVLVFGDGWPVVAGELLASVVFRSLVLAVVVRAAWPGEKPPLWSGLLARGALADVVCLVATSPWATLNFIGGIISLSFPILAGVLGALVTASVLFPHAGMSPRWWSRFAPWRAMTWTLASFSILTAAAVGMAYSPGWVVVVTAAVAGAANGWCWRHVVVACATPASSRPRVRAVAVPVGLTGSLAAVLVVLAVLIAGILHTGAPATDDSQAPPKAGQQVVLLVDGFESHWNGGHPGLHLPGFYVTEYSYRGLGRRRRPLPYSSDDTTRALGGLARRFATQIARLRRLSGRPVDVLAVSEGTLVVRRYLSTHARAPVHVVILDSPLPRPDRVAYPAAAGGGYGVAGGWESGVLSDLLDAVDPSTHIRPRMAMVRSLDEQGPLYRQRSLCPAKAARIVALLPLTSAVSVPPGPLSGVPDGVVPAVHADLLHLGATRKLVAEIFHGRHEVTHYFGWGLSFQLARYSASAWEVPSLPIGLVPSWREEGGTGLGDAAFGSYGCPARSYPSSTP